MKNFFKPIFSVFISLIMMLVSIALGTTAVLNFRPLYYRIINKFVGKNNLTFLQIKENYDTLIDYNSFFGPDKLKFPHLPSSENALTHFKEVKTIFLEFQIVLIIGIIILILLILLYKKLYGTFEYLLIGGIATIFVPFTLAVFIFINFDKVFITFHKLVFNNNYWIFNYKTDPIITFLPEDFFMVCAIAIVVLVLTQGMIMIYMYCNKIKNIKNF